MIDIRLSENLELMKTMESNSVDLIYCDILYGTGRNFGDYQDLKPKRGVIEEHYIPRIKEMHRILKDTGSIYLQMDTRINHWVRCIMDDIFGYNNFLNEINYTYQHFSNSRVKKWQKCTDRILFYTKTGKHIFNVQYRPLSAISIERFGYNARGTDRKTVTNKVSKGSTIPEHWYIPNLSGNKKEKNGYPSQKRMQLIERIIKASSNEGDLVADFYAGSFTTAEVCKDLNRNFIGCDISQKGVNIGLKRCGLSCS